MMMNMINLILMIAVIFAVIVKIADKATIQNEGRKRHLYRYNNIMLMTHRHDRDIKD